jgi:hypothetical protein
MINFIKRLWAILTHKETLFEKWCRTIEDEAGL